MAGFAINIDLILKNKDVVLGIDKDGKANRRLEDTFLKQFTTKETAECLGGEEVNWLFGRMSLRWILSILNSVSHFAPF